TKYGAIFSVAPDPIVIARESDGVLLEVNEAWLRTTGYPREQAVGRPSPDLGLWAELSQREEALARVNAGGAVQNFPVRFRTADGREMDALLPGIRVVLDGEPCTVWSWRDVTDLRRAEEELRSSRHLLENVVDALPMSVFVKDLKSNYILLNRRMAEFFGLP